MEYEAKDEELIRKYLIGELAESELRAVEERIMTDREFSSLALFVEDNMVEDYLEGRLQVSDRERFENLFLATRQGAEQLQFTSTLKEYASRTSESEQVIEFKPRSRQVVFGKPLWAFAAAAILLIAAGAGIWQIFFSGSQIETGLIAFNKAYEKQRPLEARITGLNYAARISTRGVGEEKVDSTSLRRAELHFEKEAKDRPGAESFHSLGRLYLAKGDLSQAIDQLQKALGYAPQDAQIYNDLGVAYLERGKAAEKKQQGSGAQDFSESREYLNRAISIDQNLLEARFNSALLYQQVSDTRQALAEWQEYLRRDSTSPWAVEAQRNIDEIEKQTR